MSATVFAARRASPSKGSCIRLRPEKAGTNLVFFVGVDDQAAGAPLLAMADAPQRFVASSVTTTWLPLEDPSSQADSISGRVGEAGSAAPSERN
jgi:hypothetical protein